MPKKKNNLLSSDAAHETRSKYKKLVLVEDQAQAWWIKRNDKEETDNN